MVALLFEYGTPFTASDDESYDTIIKFSTGEMGFDALKEWLTKNTAANRVE